MIIFNTKGFLAGVAALFVLVICIWLKLSDGFSFLFAGIAGLFASVKLSGKGEGYAGLPTVFFIPTHVYAVLIIIVGIASFWSGKGSSGKSSDPREVKMDNDMNMVDSLAISGVDSVAHYLKTYVSVMIIKDLNPEECHYRIIENETKDKALVLVMFPRVDDLSKDAKKDFRTLMEQAIEGENFFTGKQVYLGVKDKYGLELTKAPGKKNVGFLATTLDLLPFYGEPPAKK